MNVLSLFDGMSCGMIAFERAGIKVDTYYASEIDKYSQIVSDKNYPEIIRLGDVTKWREWDIDFSTIDLLLAGFPCQAWSVAGKQGGIDDPHGKLAHDLLDLKKHIESVNPYLKFLFENVKMKKENIEYLSSIFGCVPVEINSALVSAQNRKRLYWCNWQIEQPEDRRIMLKDIVIETTGWDACIKSHGDIVIKSDKSQCLDANYYKGVDNRGQRTMIFIDDKKIGGHIRKLTTLECERLQTVPEGYTEGVSDSQRYKMLGNGWTIDVIAHILSTIEEEKVFKLDGNR